MSLVARRSTDQLLRAALEAEPESDEQGALLDELHARGDEETFELAAALLRSRDAEERVIGVDVLAQLGRPESQEPDDPDDADPEAEDEGPFHDETVLLLVDLAMHEVDVDVLQAIGTAFGHLGDPRAIPVLLGLADHPSEDVRHGVVFGLLGYDDDAAVHTLVELSADPDDDVREWATFGLGAQIDRDDDLVRDALRARLDDAHDATREEARAGLEARGALAD